jgi:hypothetical protein
VDVLRLQVCEGLFALVVQVSEDDSRCARVGEG